VKVSWRVDATNATHIAAHFTLIYINARSSIACQCKSVKTRAQEAALCIYTFMFANVDDVTFINVFAFSVQAILGAGIVSSANIMA